MVNGDAHTTGTQSTALPAAAGYPHFTVPASFIHSLPAGISFFTRARQAPLFPARADLEL